MKTPLRCLLLAAALAATAAHSAETPIYADAIAAGWDDWSWDSQRNSSNASPIHDGSASLAVTITANWGALYLHRSGAAITVGANDQLTFWVHGGTAGHSLVLKANGNQTGVNFTAAAGTWSQVTATMTALGATGTLTDIYIQDAGGTAQPAFYVDSLKLVTGAAHPPGTGPSLAVNVAAARRAISDDIYGMNYADEALAQELRLPVRRWGGNSTSRYNYLIDVHNTGSDYYFENIPDGNSTTLPNDSTADRFVDQDRRTGTRTLMTVPAMGWVAKARKNTHPYDCGFKVTVYGTQQSVDPYDTNCGNGVATNGNDITGNAPTDTSIAIQPSFITDWVTHFKGRYNTAANGGVAYYNLDNEPGLWHETHRDVHPLPLTYAELAQSNIAAAAAVKAADATAKTLGPAEWGWCGYFYAAKDNCAPGTEWSSHGSIPIVAYYLQQMKAYDQAHGVRLLDYFDLHYYPQSGQALSPAGSGSLQALRLRSTRSLWDPSYNDESWMNDIGFGPIRLIPRMRDWVTANYPGTKLAMSEYNWGGLESINGALAQADVLGIFGREGMDLATIWGPPSSGQPGAYAFRVYRNYDGNGHGFGETSVQGTSSDSDKLAVFAAQRTSDGALTLVVINKTGGDLTAALSLAGFNPQGNAATYRYSNANLGAIVQGANQAVSALGFSATYPANSITLFVVPTAVVADPWGDSDGDGIPNGIEPLEGRNPGVKDNDVFTQSRLFVMQQYRDFLAREADEAGIQYWLGQMSGGKTRAQVVDSLFSSAEFQGVIAPVARLYFAYFLRYPDYGGLQYHVGRARTGTPMATISQDFATSQEFTNRYGALTDDAFIEKVYQNVLGRGSDPTGKAYWMNYIASHTRGEVMLGFSESAEFTQSSHDRVYVTMMYAGMLRRAPDTTGFNYWVGVLGGGSGELDLINGVLASAEYHGRFLP